MRARDRVEREVNQALCAGARGRGESRQSRAGLDSNQNRAVPRPPRGALRGPSPAAQMAGRLPFRFPAREDVLRRCATAHDPDPAFVARQDAIRAGFSERKVRLRHLEIIEEVGKGCLGIVFRARVRDPELARLVGGKGEVALKCMYNYESLSTRSARRVSQADVEPLRNAPPHPCVVT